MPTNRAVISTDFARFVVASTQRVLISALPTTASTPDNACESMRNVGMSLRGMDTPSSVRSAVGTMDEMESKYHCIVNPITSATSLGAATGTLLRLSSSWADASEIIWFHRNVGPSKSVDASQLSLTKSTMSSSCCRGSTLIEVVEPSMILPPWFRSVVASVRVVYRD